MSLPDELRRPDAWPAPRPTHIELIETHVSWVLLGEHDVFKVKKPVSLGFLDFRTADRRRAACESEVRLNARLAPGVYRGVTPIVRRADGAVVFGGIAAEGEVVDWAVHMARLEDGTRADTLLAHGALSNAHLDAIANTVAELHRAAVVAPDRAAQFASPAAIERNVLENFRQIRDSMGNIVDDDVACEVERRQTAFVRDHASLLQARLSSHVCDGHGDLRLEHVYLTPQGLRIIDCIEFDERYRIADECADVAFLAMDLSSSGRADLGERFLARYARAAQDYDLYALVDFYESYRAWIRGKVAVMLVNDRGADERTRARASAEARNHFLLAQACERAPLLSPTLVCVGGIVASGKSTVADALADELACPVVDTDRTRKQLLRRASGGATPPGRSPPEASAAEGSIRRPARLAESGAEEAMDGLWQGAYAPAITDRVYAEALRRAAVVLSSGRSVVVDGSFHASSMRHRARDLALCTGADFRFVHCQAPIDTCRERLASRRGGPSEAHLAMFDAFAASFERLSDLPAAEIVALDTTKPAALSVDVLRDRIAALPRGLR